MLQELRLSDGSRLQTHKTEFFSFFWSSTKECEYSKGGVTAAMLQSYHKSGKLNGSVSAMKLNCQLKYILWTFLWTVETILPSEMAGLQFKMDVIIL